MMFELLGYSSSYSRVKGNAAISFKLRGCGFNIKRYYHDLLRK